MEIPVSDFPIYNLDPGNVQHIFIIPLYCVKSFVFNALSCRPLVRCRVGGT